MNEKYQENVKENIRKIVKTNKNKNKRIGPWGLKSGTRVLVGTQTHGLMGKRPMHSAMDKGGVWSKSG